MALGGFDMEALEKKKRAAAVAAVIEYLEGEQAGTGRGPSGYPSPWALAGRMAAMQAGWMMQMRALDRLRRR